MIKRLVLLPGMDGTGDLFAQFATALPESIKATIVRYPTHAVLSYDELMAYVSSGAPPSEPYVLLAESFSTPLAVQYAASKPPNLCRLVLCAGFATSPIRGWRRSLASLIAPLAFRLPLPKVAVSHFLVGKTAPESLHASVRAAIRSVEPAALAARIHHVLAVDVRPALNQVSVPILFVQALQDRLVGDASLAELIAIKPQIRVARIEGPHLILQREPQQAAAAVASFIQQRPSD